MSEFKKFLQCDRHPIAWTLPTTFVISLAARAAALSERETFRIVHIHRRRGDLRNGVPPQLTYEKVIRHLCNNGALIADHLDHGIDYDGTPDGEWRHQWVRIGRPQIPPICRGTSLRGPRLHAVQLGKSTAAGALPKSAAAMDLSAFEKEDRNKGGNYEQQHQ